MRPTVATAPGSARASSCAASTARAAGTSASRRPAIAAVPAWSETPRNVQRQRSRAASDVATASGAGTSTRLPSLLDVHLDPGAHPRQECRRGSRSSGAGHAAQRPRDRAGRCPRGRCARGPRRGRARRRARASRRSPRRNAGPSSSTIAPTASGRGAPPARRAASTATNPATTPSAPSNAPPSATESRCEPTASKAPVGAARLDRPEVGGRILRDLQPECRRRSSGTTRARHPRPAPRPSGSSHRARARSPRARRTAAGRAPRRSHDHALPRCRR